MVPRAAKRIIEIPQVLIFAAYLIAILFIGWLIEPEVITDYVRIVLIGATAVMNLLTILAVIAHGHMGERRRLPTWVVAGMASSWLAPLDWIALSVIRNLGDPLSVNSAILFFSLVWAAFWLREMTDHVR